MSSFFVTPTTTVMEEDELKEALKKAGDKKIVEHALGECPRAREELVTQAMIDSVSPCPLWTCIHSISDNA